MAEKLQGWVNLPTSTVTGEASLEYILAVGIVVIVFALGFQAGQQR